MWCNKFMAFLSFMSHNYNTAMLVLEAFFTPLPKAVFIWSKDFGGGCIIYWRHLSGGKMNSSQGLCCFG